MTVQTRFRVDGMDCASCAAKIDIAVRRLPGVEDVNVSVAAATMTVHDDVELGSTRRWARRWPASATGRR